MLRLLPVFCIVFVLVYLLPLGGRPLVTPDEGRYGAIPAEMLDTGEWVTPHLNGIRYYEKPVLGYWFIAASEWVFGRNAFAIRLPSALATCFGALCLVLLARRLGLRDEVGWLAGIAYLTMIAVLISGTTAVLDAMFTGAVTGALVFFVMAWTSKASSSRIGWLTVFGGFCGLAFLIKGFLGLAIPVIVIGPFLLWMRRWREIFTLPWIPMLAAAAVIAPWAIAVHLQDVDFWHYFFWVEHIQRFTGGAEAQHSEPFWYFIPVFLVGAIPWTFASLLAFTGLARGRCSTTLVRYLLCWLVIPLVFFSISSGKLPTYILPCFPAAALLVAVGLVERFDQRAPRRSFSLMIPDFLLVLAGLLCLAAWGFDLLDPSPWGESGSWRYGVMAVGFIVWALLDVAALSTTRSVRRVLLMGLSPVLMFAFIPLLLPTNWMGDYKAPEAFLTKHGEVLGDPEAIVITDSQLFHAVNWLYGRYDVLIFGHPGEVAWGIEDHPNRLLDGSMLVSLIASESRQRPVVVLLRGTDVLPHVLANPAIPEPRAIHYGREISLAVFGPEQGT